MASMDSSTRKAIGEMDGLIDTCAALASWEESLAAPYDGRGSCYIEFGHELVGRVDVQFLPGRPPAGTFTEPSLDVTAEKTAFGSTRRARWFGT